MNKAYLNYLQKNAVLGPWEFEKEPGTGVAMVVVIPVLAESDRLFLSLDDLGDNDPDLLAKTLVICVVNNRVPGVAEEADCIDNQRCLAQLPAYAASHPTLRLTWIDASSPGRELGAGEGVGLARKIGLDAGLRVLLDNGVPEGPLISLDGDTRVAPNYLGTIDTFFSAAPRWAAVVAYAHPIDGDADETRAILAYEFFLRYQERSLYDAGSPYHYPAIGSTMICTPTAYVASGGMNRRQAGEDFYFLQQLAKTGRVEQVWDTVVVPASRPSHRVPFGTGRKVGAFAADGDDAYRIYHPSSFVILEAWLQKATADLDRPGAELGAEATAIYGALGHFLSQQRFEQTWDRMRAQTKSAPQRLRRFHEWFDAFRTLKLTHHLRDNGFPRQDLFEALGTVLGRHDRECSGALSATLRHDLDGQRALMGQLRQWRPGG